MRAIALALLLLGLSVTTGLAAGYRLLVLDGQPIKWGDGRYGAGASLTYSFVREPIEFPDAINCKAMVPVTVMLRRSGIGIQDFHAEIREAFRIWEQVANLHFAYVEDPSRADIIIGAQATPRGIAFANVWHKRAEDKPLAEITRASFCLNPELRWERSFDGDVGTPSLRHVASHEIGHTIGLDHPGRNGQLMGFHYSEDLTGLQSGDVTGAVKLYGAAQAKAARR
jgi:Matrixin